MCHVTVGPSFVLLEATHEAVRIWKSHLSPVPMPFNRVIVKEPNSGRERGGVYSLKWVKVATGHKERGSGFSVFTAC